MSETINKPVQEQQDKQQKEEQAKKGILISELKAFINEKPFNGKLVNAMLDSFILSNKEINGVKEDLQKILDDSKKKETGKSKLASTFLQKLNAMEIVNNIPNEIQTIKNNNGFYSYEMAEYIKNTFDNKILGKDVISKFCDKFGDQIKVLSELKEKQMEISPMPEKQQTETLPMTPKECRMFVHCMSAGLENVGLFPEHFLELGNGSAEVTRNENESDFEFVKRSSLAIIDTNKLTMFALNLKDGYVGTFCKQQILDQITPMIQGQINDIFTQGKDIKLSLEEKKKVCNEIAEDIINSFRNNVNVQGVAQSSDGLDIDLKDKQQILSEYVELSYEKAKKMELQKQLEALGKKLDETTKNYNESTALTSTQASQIEEYKQQFSDTQSSIEKLQTQVNEKTQQLEQTTQEKDQLARENSIIRNSVMALQGVVQGTPDNTKSVGDNQNEIHSDKALTMDDLNTSSGVSNADKSNDIITSASNLIQSQSNENASLRGEIANLQEQLGKMQKQFDSLTNEDEKLKQQLAIEQQQNQLLIDKNKELEAANAGQEEDIQRIAHEFELTNNNLQDLFTKNNTLLQEKQVLENKINELNARNDELSKGLEDAQLLGATLEQKVNILKIRNEEISLLLKVARQANADQQRQIAELRKQSRQKDEEIARIQEEDKKLREQLQERDRDIEKLKRKADEIEAKRQSIQGLYSSTENSKDKRIGQYVKDLNQIGYEHERLLRESKLVNEDREKLRGQLETVQKQLTIARDEKTTVDQERKQLVEQLQRKNETITEMQRQIASQQQQITGLQDQIKNLQEEAITQRLEITSANAKIAQLGNLNKILQSERDSSLKQAKKAQEAIERSTRESRVQRGQITELEKRNSQYERQIKELQQQLGLAQNNNEKQAKTIETQQKQLQDKVQELQKKEQELAKATEQLKEQQQKIAAQEQEIETQKKALEQAKEAKEQLQQQLAEKQREIEGLNEQLSASNQRINDLNGKIENISDIKEQLVKQGEDLEKQIRTLESTIEQNEKQNKEELEKKQSEVDKLKNESLSKDTTLADQQRQLDELKGQLAANQRAQQQKEEESRRVLEEKKQLEQSKTQLEGQLQQEQQQIEDLEKENNNLADKIGNQRQELNIKGEKFKELQTKWQQAKAMAENMQQENAELRHSNALMMMVLTSKSMQYQQQSEQFKIQQKRLEEVEATLRQVQQEQDANAAAKNQLQDQLQEQKRLVVAAEATNAAALEEQKQTYERQAQQAQKDAERRELQLQKQNEEQKNAYQEEIDKLKQQHQQKEKQLQETQANLAITNAVMNFLKENKQTDKVVNNLINVIGKNIDNCSLDTLTSCLNKLDGKVQLADRFNKIFKKPNETSKTVDNNIRSNKIKAIKGFNKKLQESIQKKKEQKQLQSEAQKNLEDKFIKANGQIEEAVIKYCKYCENPDQNQEQENLKTEEQLITSIQDNINDCGSKKLQSALETLKNIGGLRQNQYDKLIEGLNGITIKETDSQEKARVELKKGIIQEVVLSLVNTQKTEQLQQENQQLQNQLKTQKNAHQQEIDDKNAEIDAVKAEAERQLQQTQKDAKQREQQLRKESADALEHERTKQQQLQEQLEVQKKIHEQEEQRFQAANATLVARNFYLMTGLSKLINQLKEKETQLQAAVRQFNNVHHLLVKSNEQNRKDKELLRKQDDILAKERKDKVAAQAALAGAAKTHQQETQQHAQEIEELDQQYQQQLVAATEAERQAQKDAEQREQEWRMRTQAAIDLAQNQFGKQLQDQLGVQEQKHQQEIVDKDAKIAELEEQVRQLQKEREQHQQLQEQVEKEKAEKTAKTIKLKVGNDEFSVELSDIKLDGKEFSGEDLAKSLKETFKVKDSEPVEVANIFEKANEYVEKDNKVELKKLQGILDGLSGDNTKLKIAVMVDETTLKGFTTLDKNLKGKYGEKSEIYKDFRKALLKEFTIIKEIVNGMKNANILDMEVKAQAVDKEVQAEVIQNKEGAVQTQLEDVTPSASTVVKDTIEVSELQAVKVQRDRKTVGKDGESAEKQTEQSTGKAAVLNVVKPTQGLSAEKNNQQDSTAQKLSAQEQLTRGLNNTSNQTTSKDKTVEKSETFVYYKCIQKKEGKDEDIGLKTELGDGDIKDVTFPIELQIESEKATLGEVVAYAKSVLESMNQEVNPDNIMKMLDLQGQGIGEEQLKAAKKSIANKIKKFASEGVGLTEEKLREEANTNDNYKEVLKSVEAKASTLIKNNDKINGAAQSIGNHFRQQQIEKQQASYQVGSHQGGRGGI